MKFTENVHFYCVNEDNTVTIYFIDESGIKQFYRCAARFKLLTQIEDYAKDTELTCVFGLAYVRGRGLVLQLIDVCC